MSIKTRLFDLTGKVALVSGGASGIGKAIAAEFVRHGAKVVVGSRTLEKVEAAAKELDGIGNNSGDEAVAAGVALDVEKDESVDHAVRKTMDLFGGLHIVVNSAGVMCKKPTFDLTPDEMNWLYNIHVVGAFRVSKAAGQIFREQHDGCIINIASISSYVSLTEVTAYACAKSAMMGLTHSLANEWAKYGIRTNGIAPGFVPTDINRKMIEGTDRGRRILEHTPMERFGTGDEIAGAAVYLASEAGKFTNGVTIPIDGGYLASGIGDSVAPWEKDNA
jgi:NAD(P)-dependent dehydrogenase (short-subunit alcohol dehydrogenase family)